MFVHFALHCFTFNVDGISLYQIWCIIILCSTCTLYAYETMCTFLFSFSHLSFFISQLFIFHFSTCHLSFIRSPFIICSVSYVQFLSPVYEMSYTSYNVSCFQMCNANVLVVMYHDVLFLLSALLL